MAYIQPDDTPVAYIDLYYSATHRSWIVMRRSAEGFQVDGAEYIGAGGGGRAIAQGVANDWATQYGVEIRKG